MTLPDESPTSSRHSPECLIPDVAPSLRPIVGQISFHHLVIFLGTICAALAILISAGHILHHAARCFRVQEQKYVMRVILVIPAFASVYTLACWYYPSFQYVSVVPEIVEAFSFVSLFQLFVLLATGTTDRREQEAYFQQLPRLKRKPLYALLVPRLRKQPSPLQHQRGSLRWFRAMWLALFQFPVVKFVWTILSIILTYAICPTSKAGSGVRVLSGLVNALTTGLALWAMIVFYARLSTLLKPRHAFRKAFIFKKMIGIILAQALIMSFVSAAGAIKPTAQMSFGDYTIGIPAFMAQCEMFLFSIVFVYCYNVREFQLVQQADQEAAPNGAHAKKTSFFRAIWALINISDFLRGLFTAARDVPRILKREYTVDATPDGKMSPLSSVDSGVSAPNAPPMPSQYQPAQGAQAGYAQPHYGTAMPYNSFPLPQEHPPYPPY